jgi:hypothetical protein
MDINQNLVAIASEHFLDLHATGHEQNLHDLERMTLSCGALLRILVDLAGHRRVPRKL